MDKPTVTRRSACPVGVEVRPGARGDRLRVTFTWLGQRRRETLDIPATAANIKYASRLRAEVMNAIERGTFDYAAFFPNSDYAKATGRRKKAYKVAELVRDYLETARKTGGLSPSTILGYMRWADKRILPMWGDTRADDLSPAELRKWIADLGQELSAKSVRNCAGFLSAVLTRAASDGLIKENALARIKLRTLLPRRAELDEVDPFNDEEIAAILQACATPQERALFQFAFASGLRTGELIALKWENVDFGRGEVTVRDNIVTGEGGAAHKTTKTGKSRVIPMLPAARDALKTMQAYSRLEDGYVFTHPVSGRRWTDDQQIRNRWRKTLAAAKVRYRYPYQTRHTFASKLLESGEQELLVAKLLGHTTVEMVRRHYGRYIHRPDGIALRGDYSGYGAKLGANLGQVSAGKAGETKKTETG